MAEAPITLDDPAWTGRRLLRAARVGTLATSSRDGAPHAALVTPACLADGAPVLLLSRLSEHTRQLEADPRCALLVTGASDDPNPQTMPRLSAMGTAHQDATPATREHYLAIHPYAALYAGFGDFAFWRITVTHAHFVGGFARAAKPDAAALRPQADAARDVADAAAEIMAQCNMDNDMTARLARHAGGGSGSGGNAWRVVHVDVDGCDLADTARSLRLAWQAPAGSAADVRAELARWAACDAAG